MKRGTPRSIVLVAFIAAVIAGASFLWMPFEPATQGFGVEDVMAPDPADRPLSVRIWYPAAPGDKAKINGTGLPLIVLSHGTGGSLMGHTDTATALARAGFVVAAVNHTGDNYRDDSYIGKGVHLVGRPRHVARVIDHMLTRWSEHARIDPDQIGMFGHSAGGFTALVIAGGEPDMSRGAEHCRVRPEAWDCLYLKGHGFDPNVPSDRRQVSWIHDPRVKAAVIAAPAVGYSFEPDGLAGMRIPVQLWEAQHDAIVEDSPAIVKRLLPQAPDHRLVARASHLSFLAPCDWRMKTIVTVMSWSGMLNICDDREGFDRARFHDEFNRDVIAFFREALP